MNHISVLLSFKRLAILHKMWYNNIDVGNNLLQYYFTMGGQYDCQVRKGGKD